MKPSQAPAQSPPYARITGWGMSVPDKIVTNDDLAHIVDTTDEWIVSRTGIRERHIVASDRETTASLATKAAKAALQVAGISPAELNLVIVATATPEYTFPSTASLVQDAIGARNAGAFDLSAGCSGFLYALTMASHAIRSGEARQVLVIGAETLSRVTDWSNRDTCVLFGDGAGAVVVGASAERCGVISTVLGSDGSGGELLMLPGGGSRLPASHETVSNGDHFIKMKGREVFRFAATIVPKATEAVAERAGWAMSDVALLIPHQANTRIIEAAAKRLEFGEDRVFVNLDRYGNTSAASIPIALCEALGTGRIHVGDKVVLVGFGAGLTWGAAAVEWGEPVKAPSWWRQMLANLRFGWATVRSTGLRSGRWLYNIVLGPEGKDDWRGRLRRLADAVRKGARNKA